VCQADAQVARLVAVPPPPLLLDGVDGEDHGEGAQDLHAHSLRRVAVRRHLRGRGRGGVSSRADAGLAETEREEAQFYFYFLN